MNNNRLELVQTISTESNILNENANNHLPQTQENFPNFWLIQSQSHLSLHHNIYATLNTSRHMDVNTRASQINNHFCGSLQSHMAVRVTVKQMHTGQVSSDLNVCVNPTPLHSDNSDNQTMHSWSDTAALVSLSLSVAVDDNPVSKQNETHYENNARQSNMNAELCPDKPSKINEVSIQNTPSYSQENVSQSSNTNSQICNSPMRGRSRSPVRMQGQKRGRNPPAHMDELKCLKIDLLFFPEPEKRPLHNVWVSQDSINRTIEDVTVQSD